MGVKSVSLAIFICLIVSSVKCAKIIPLEYETDTSDHQSNSNYAGQLEQSEYYYSNGQRRADFAEEVVGDEAAKQSSDVIATIMPSTDVQLPSNSRESRKMRQDVTTTKPRKSKNKESLMSRILPMLVMPFLVSSSLIPMMLTSLKFMLLKSLFVGKIAIVLLALNALWKSDNRGGVYSHNVNMEHEQKDLHKSHYGYNGDEEYGAYVNRRRSEFR